MTIEDEVILLNEGYVHWMARRFEGLEYHDDIMQVARLGVIHAFHAYDSEKGAWATYLILKIKSQIHCYLGTMNSKKRSCSGPEVCLDALLDESDEEAGTFGDKIADTRIDVEAEALDAVERETILSAIKNPRYRLALELRIDGLTLEETGEVLGVTGVRASQLEMKALQEIRRARVA
jgi:RNA polymerase sigma factor (sigma-70 family)